MSRLDDAIRGSAAILDGPKPKGIIKEPYVAFAAPTGDPQLRVILYARKFFMMPQYSVLYDVFFEGKGEYIALIFPHHRVSLWGRNLLPLVTALRTNSVEWLREFNPLFFDEPTDPEAPVIEEAEIHSKVENPLGNPERTEAK